MTLEGAAIRAANEAKDERRRHLAVVDTQTGEVVEHDEQCEGCRQLAVEVEGLEEAHRSAMAKVRLLRRDKEAEARSSEYWPAALEAFNYWRTETGHGRTQWSVDRFHLLEPYLKKDGLEMVKLAIDGAAFNPYKASAPNRNGKVEVYDGLETIFKTRGAFERHCNRAPVERIRAVKEAGELTEPSPVDLRCKAEVILALMPTDQRTPYERASEAVLEAARELGIDDRRYFYDLDAMKWLARTADEMAPSPSVDSST